MLRYGTSALFLFLFIGIHAQNLLPSINSGILPQNTDSICVIPVYTGDYQSSGLQVGDTVPDFTLFTLTGDTIHLLSEMQAGKPVLLVAGSYTCPVFRNQIPDLSSIYNTYQNDVLIYVIYTVEAHPKTDPSPYSGTVWITSQNQQDSILYRQPQLYGQRRMLVNTMLSDINILPEVGLDGPCNEWWLNYGPAPNNAYLIDPNGIVFSKHDWFNRSPLDMACDIDSLLNNSGCSGSGSNGNFSFYLSGDSLEYDYPGNTVYVKGYLRNNSLTEAVTIDLIRESETVPAGWSTAMCIDICLPAWTDSTELFLNPGDSQLYTMYFYTDTIPAAGSARIRFSNRNNASNAFIQEFYGSTYPVGIKNEWQPFKWTVYPNPSGGTFYVKGGEECHYTLYSMGGQELRTGILKNGESLITGKPGTFILKLSDETTTEMLKLVVVPAY